MKSKIFINSSSFGNNSSSKWKKIQAHFPNLTPVLLPPIRLTPEMKTQIANEGLLLVGGGDGTIHHVINSVFQSDSDFNKIRLGIFGLGSSCSFLRSFKGSKKIEGIPYIADFEKETAVDIGRIKFKKPDGNIDTKYFAANGSIGFLALGNILFNQPGGLNEKLKGISTEMANNYIFVKSLIRYQPLPLSVNGAAAKNYLNIQFLKSKYYTGDYYFERDNSAQSGLLDIHLIDYRGRLNTMNVFYQLTMKNEYPSSGHLDYRNQTLHVLSETEIPFEVDGEVYFGTEFWIECIPQKLRLMSEGNT